MKIPYKIICAFFLVVVTFYSHANADKINLKNGNTLKGEIINAGSDSVTVETGFGKQTVPKDEVLSVEYEKTAEVKAEPEEVAASGQKEDSQPDRSRKLYVNVNGIIGARALTDPTAKAAYVNNHAILGLDTDIGYGYWPSLLVAFSSSSGTGTTWTSSYTVKDQVDLGEFDYGVRYYFLHEGFRPYVSVGFASISATETITCTSGCTGTTNDSKTTDTATGTFFNTGIMWHPRFGMNFGVDYKALSGAYFKNHPKQYADYSQIVFLIGYGW